MSKQLFLKCKDATELQKELQKYLDLGATVQPGTFVTYQAQSEYSLSGYAMSAFYGGMPMPVGGRVRPSPQESCFGCVLTLPDDLEAIERKLKQIEWLRAYGNLSVTLPGPLFKCLDKEPLTFRTIFENSETLKIQLKKHLPAFRELLSTRFKSQLKPVWDDLAKLYDIE